MESLSKNPQNILIIQTAFLGDLILSIAFFKHCKKLWPQTQIHLICRENIGSFFTKIKVVDHIYEIKKGDKKSYKDVVGILKEMNFDIILSPHESWRSARLAGKLNSPLKVCFAKIFKQVFFNTLVVKDLSLPDPVRQLSLLTPFDNELATQIAQYKASGRAYQTSHEGLLSAPPDWATVHFKQFFKNDSAGFLDLKNKLNLKHIQFDKTVLLFPGSVWATKRWTAEGFIQLGQQLVQDGYTVIIMGGPGEESLCEVVARNVTGALSLANKTDLYESCLLIANSALVIGNDSAASHLASLCHTPLIAIFGPTVLQFGYRPWTDNAYIIENKKLACRPCGKHGHKKCPLGTHECMKHIGANEVIELSRTILLNSPSH